MNIKGMLNRREMLSSAIAMAGCLPIANRIGLTCGSTRQPIATADDFGNNGISVGKRCDPLWSFRPYNWQAELFGLSGNVRQIIVTGGLATGKSTPCAVMTAAFAMNRSVTTFQPGTDYLAPTPVRSASQLGKKLRIAVVANNEVAIGPTLYKMLFRAGLFRIVHDKWNNYSYWSSVNPVARQDWNCAKLGPPLIPPTWIKAESWQWINKCRDTFRSVTIRNPRTGRETADIMAYSSATDLLQEGKFDLIWFDEVRRSRSFLLNPDGLMIASTWGCREDYPINHQEEMVVIQT